MCELEKNCGGERERERKKERTQGERRRRWSGRLKRKSFFFPHKFVVLGDKPSFALLSRFRAEGCVYSLREPESLSSLLSH